eukprot:364741-Chlamydomonas_euryale.AAC.3
MARAPRAAVDLARQLSCDKSSCKVVRDRRHLARWSTPKVSSGLSGSSDLNDFAQRNRSPRFRGAMVTWQV